MFENPMPGAESPFSQQCERFLDNLERSSTCSSLLAVEFTMVYRHGFNPLQINSYVFSEECKLKKSVRSTTRWHLRSANSASITSPSHWPSSGDVWVRACNVWLPQGPGYSMNVVVHIGKPRLYKPRDCRPIIGSAEALPILCVRYAR